jgi:hypothetical protein
VLRILQVDEAWLFARLGRIPYNHPWVICLILAENLIARRNNGRPLSNHVSPYYIQPALRAIKAVV